MNDNRKDLFFALILLFSIFLKYLANLPKLILSLLYLFISRNITFLPAYNRDLIANFFIEIIGAIILYFFIYQTILYIYKLLDKNIVKEFKFKNSISDIMQKNKNKIKISNLVVIVFIIIFITIFSQAIGFIINKILIDQLGIKNDNIEFLKLDSIHISYILALIISTMIYSPIEEVLFRDYYFKKFSKDRIVFINSLTFSFYHLLNGLSGVVSAFLISFFILSPMYNKYKNIKYNAISHIIINLIILFLQYLL